MGYKDTTPISNPHLQVPTGEFHYHLSSAEKIGVHDQGKIYVTGFGGSYCSRQEPTGFLLHVAAVVVAYQVLGGIAEWLIASDLSAALQDFKIGFPGMLLQVVLGWVILKGVAKYEC